LVHTWPTGQACPHEPQLALLLVVSTQLPLQLVVEPEHDAEHWPALQTFAAEH
jgi:hypothetical protein